MAKTAIVFGSTGGIGAEIVDRLDRLGHRLVLVDIDGEGLEAQAGHCRRATTHVLDQNDMAAVERFCDEIVLPESAPDVAVVNAGVITVGELTSIGRRDVCRQIRINLLSAAILIQALAQVMRGAGRGHILVTVSVGGVVALKGSATYSASKFGLRGLLWALRDELAPHGVHVTGIYPAGVDTAMLRHEARNGGSALNFVSDPVSAGEVADAFMRAIERPRLEIYVPASEGITGRLAGAFPGLLRRLYPLLERLGERGRVAFLKRIGDP